MRNFGNLTPLAARPKIDGLSEPEKRVLKHAANGHSNEVIAAKIHRTIATVRSHLSNAAVKLGVSGSARPTTAAVFQAKERGYI